MNNQAQQQQICYDDQDDNSYSSYYSDDAIMNSDDEESSIREDDDYLDLDTREWQRAQFYKKQKEKELSATHTLLESTVRQPVDVTIPTINPWNKQIQKQETPIMSLNDIMKCQIKETEEEKSYRKGQPI